jgi:two-component system cell cycle sensor histidine kinase/response regulator CckA
MGTMLRRLIGEDVELGIAYALTLGRTRADVGQFEQVLMNLVVNARDAMPSGGKLTIETSNVEVDADNARLHPGITPGRYVALTVRDTGMGMDLPTKARVFEPFFTTKQHGKGTGLGLSMVYGIVKQSGGHILLDSAPARGTTFTIYFTRTSDPISQPAPPERPRPALPGSETLLLVEDDEQVRTIACQILKLNGYRVLEAKSPNDALEQSLRFAERIDLLITDVVMPEMNGRILAERLCQQRRELQVLYMSGYTDNLLDPGGVPTGAAFLQKPITPVSLASSVRQLLDDKRSAVLAPVQP